MGHRNAALPQERALSAAAAAASACRFASRASIISAKGITGPVKTGLFPVRCARDSVARGLAPTLLCLEGRAHIERGQKLACSLRARRGAAFLKRMAPWFYADAVQNGRSPLAGTLRSSRIFSPAVTLIDAGNFPEACPVFVVRYGRARSRRKRFWSIAGSSRISLYDTYAATRENRLSTGNFSRPPQADDPHIAATNFYLQPSEATARELLSQLDRGILLESIVSIQSSGQSSSGESFSVKVLLTPKRSGSFAAAAGG